MTCVQTSPLLAIAPEVVLLIGDELDVKSLKNLRLASKHLAGSLVDAVFRCYSIDLRRENIQKCLSKLSELAITPLYQHPAHRSTRTLKIRSMVLDSKMQPHGLVWKNDRWIMSNPGNPEEPVEVRLAEQAKACLGKAISSLKGVQEVYWTPYQRDAEWAQLAVVESMQALPNLNKIQITALQCNIRLPFYLLQNLRHISIDASNCFFVDEGQAMFDSLAKAIATLGPQLTYVDVSYNWRCSSSPMKIRSLHGLFKYYPRGAAPLQLRHLALNACFVSWDDYFISHLRRLTSLELTRIRYLDQSQSSGTIENELCQSGSEAIWSALTESGIHLEKIVLDVVPSTFITYLSSYSGLKKLHIFSGGFNDGRSSDLMAERFFEKAIGAHARSLEDLEILACFQGSWCFGEHNLSSIWAFPELRNLHVRIISSELWKESDFKLESTPSAKQDTVKTLLDLVVAGMPRLEHLRIAPTKLESDRNRVYFNINGSIAYFNRVRQQLAYSAGRYTAPPLCTSLPSLAIDSFKFGLFDVVRDSANFDNTALGGLKYVSNTPLKKQNRFGLYK